MWKLLKIFLHYYGRFLSHICKNKEDSETIAGLVSTFTQEKTEEIIKSHSNFKVLKDFNNKEQEKILNGLNILCTKQENKDIIDIIKSRKTTEEIIKELKEKD